MNLFRPYETSNPNRPSSPGASPPPPPAPPTSTVSQQSAVPPVPVTSGAGAPSVAESQQHHLAAAMAAAAMAMARAAAINPADLLANPAAAAALMMTAGQQSQQLPQLPQADMKPQVAAGGSNGRSSPISDRGSPPVSPVPASTSTVPPLEASPPGVINLTKANGEALANDPNVVNGHNVDDEDINVDDEADEEVKKIVKA